MAKNSAKSVQQIKNLIKRYQLSELELAAIYIYIATGSKSIAYILTVRAEVAGAALSHIADKYFSKKKIQSFLEQEKQNLQKDQKWSMINEGLFPELEEVMGSSENEEGNSPKKITNKSGNKDNSNDGQESRFTDKKIIFQLEKAIDETTDTKKKGDLLKTLVDLKHRTSQSDQDKLNRTYYIPFRE